MSSTTLPPSAAPLTRWRQYTALTKPRVIQLIVFCALIGMLLAVPGVPGPHELGLALAASVGIGLVASAAAAFNCLIEQHIDARMKRTAWRPTARGDLSRGQALLFSAVLGGAGMVLLHQAVNPLTAWLTFGTFVGYAVVYTVILKPLTPQNIVIGGASGAMPPLLGWTAMTGEVSPEAVGLFLIIFLWTPPHFWALALFVRSDYAAAGIPMMPVVAGEKSTRRQILFYALILVPATLLPFIQGLSGLPYLFAALVLGALFIARAWKLWRGYSELLARKTFRFSIWHLSLLFGALLIDHYLRPWL